jgi:hypothetical protein
MTKLDEKWNKDSDLPSKVAATQQIHKGGGQGVGIEIEQGKQLRCHCSLGLTYL